jgi:D-serine deaminase-like pyridoxal phosphate-dependent protein
MKRILDQYAWHDDYRISSENVDRVLTPALAIFPDIVDANISTTLRLLGGDPSRWRPHVKTAKLGYVMRRLVEHGVRNFKCATTLELRTALEVGAEDVLLAYPVIGPAAERVEQIADEFPSARASVLVESEAQVPQWRGSRIGIFVDLNPGMNRTGVAPQQHRDVLNLVRAITNVGREFRGLHYYDGQLGSLDFSERTATAHRGYDELMSLVAELDRAGFPVAEVITAGTPAFPCSIAYAAFRNAAFVHRVSPGTVVYSDATSLSQLPAEYGYRPGALVLSRVVSHPTAKIVTCDAGHKTVSADAGLPTCIAIGHPELRGLFPSEEHLPFEVLNGAAAPKLGNVLYLLPRHICPSVNNFDHALMVSDGKIEAVEPVTARGREAPVLQTARLQESAVTRG